MYAIPNESFSIVMERGDDVKFIKDKEYEYRKLADYFIIKGENGAVKLDSEEVKELFTREVHVK